jgi:hypothetical protein
MCNKIYVRNGKEFELVSVKINDDNKMVYFDILRKRK